MALFFFFISAFLTLSGFAAGYVFHEDKPAKVVELEVPRIEYVDRERLVPFAVDRPVPGPERVVERKVFVLRDHKVFVPRECPSVARALNHYELLMR